MLNPDHLSTSPTSLKSSFSFLLSENITSSIGGGAFDLANSRGDGGGGSLIRFIRMTFSHTFSIVCDHLLFHILVKKPNLGLLSKSTMMVMYNSSRFVAMAGATELLGVFVAKLLCVKSGTDNFVDNSLVINVINDYDAAVEEDMMIGVKE